MEKERTFNLTKDFWKAVTFCLSREDVLDSIEFKVLDKDEIRFNINIDPTIQQAIVTLDTMLWTGQEEKIISYPKTWWDAFKLRFFKPWMLRLFPVTKTVVKIKEVVPKLPEEFKSQFALEEDDFVLPSVEWPAEELDSYQYRKEIVDELYWGD